MGVDRIEVGGTLGIFSQNSFKPNFSYYTVTSAIPSIASLVAQLVKKLLAVQETRVQSLGQKDPLEKGMATHSNILAYRIPWTAAVHGVTKGQTQLSNTFIF